MGIDEGWLAQCFGNKKKNASAIEKASKMLQELVLDEDSASEMEDKKSNLETVPSKTGTGTVVRGVGQVKSKTRRVKKKKKVKSSKLSEEKSEKEDDYIADESQPETRKEDESNPKEREEQKIHRKNKIHRRRKVVDKPEVDLWWTEPLLHKNLIVLDFDHTIIDYNTDVEIQTLVTIPDNFRLNNKTNGWTRYMQEVFKFLHHKGIRPKDIYEFLRELDPTPGMMNLIYHAKRTGYEIVIISDSNKVFVEHILKLNGMLNYVDEIFTNPARFNRAGLLEIKPYHEQNYCTLSSRNLCKGQVLLDYVYERKRQGVEFDTVAVIGDGRNDICPMLKLRETDIAFVRDGFTLHKFVNEEMPYDPDLKIDAKIVLWQNGQQIWENLSKHTGINLLQVPFTAHQILLRRTPSIASTAKNGKKLICLFTYLRRRSRDTTRSRIHHK